MRSLRFRLPALFLAGMLLAAVVTAVIATTLFQDVTRNDSQDELQRQAASLSKFYADQALAPAQANRRASRAATKYLEAAAGPNTRLFYAGLELFPGEAPSLRTLPVSVLPDRKAAAAGRAQTFEFKPPGEDRTYLAAAAPLKIGDSTFGFLVAAKPRAELRDRWVPLVERLGIAFLGGLIVALGLVWYVSRKLTAPLLRLTRATDEVAAGRYDVALPPAGRDEVGRLTSSFGQMATRLAEAEELERNFLMSVSHELRTPLTAIRGHVEALSEGLVDDPAARDASLEVIRGETDRLARLVGDVLDLAKLDANRFRLAEEEVELGRLVGLAYQARTEEARQRGIAYDETLSANPVLTTDGDRVLQIVTNLIDNAFVWTPDGGRIGVSVGQANGTASVAVTDNGPGIPEEDRERIFRPFFTGDRVEGTGLGLAIARELALALGGEISLETEVGRGSCFELRLPVS